MGTETASRLPTATVRIPKGSLGVSFKSAPPTVMKLKDDSPMQGKLKEGYCIDTLYLGDGSEYTNLTTTKLIKLLGESKDDEDRKFKVVMKLPKRPVVVPLPPGKDVGLTVEGTPPMVTKIAPDSPVNEHVRVSYGLVVDSVTLGDGTVLTGHTSEEIMTALENDDEPDNTERIMTLISTDITPSERSVKLPENKKITIPPGASIEGVSFEGKRAEITSVAEDGGAFRVGMIADVLCLPDGTEYTGLSAYDIEAKLKASADAEGRYIYVRSKESAMLSERATTKVMLPRGTTSDFGLVMDGDPATIEEVKEDSPFKSDIRTGFEMISYYSDDIEYDEVDADDLEEAIEDTKDEEGRWLLFENEPLDLPDFREVQIPTGDLDELGMSVTDWRRHAEVSDVRHDSTIRGAVRVGMIVDALILPDGTEFCGLPASDLIDEFEATADVEGRVIHLKSKAKKSALSRRPTTKILLKTGGLEDLGLVLEGDPAILAEVTDPSLVSKVKAGYQLTTLCDTDETEYDDLDAITAEDLLEDSKDVEGRWMIFANKMAMPDEISVMLPAGRLGLSFKGEEHGSAPWLSKVEDDSPIRDEVVEGMLVDSVTIGGASKLIEFDMIKLIKVLVDSSETEGRVMVLKNPDTTTLCKLPDSKEVELPKGKLATVFKGSQPMIYRIDESSPMKDLFEIGLVVDTLTLGNGAILTGLTTKELVTELSKSADTEGRKMLLKNPETQVMSTRGFVLPDTIRVPLPAGKLGIGFKAHPPTVSSIKEDSSIKDYVQIGMVVDSLALDEANVLIDMDKKTLTDALMKSSDSHDRVMTLKNPETTELSKLPDSKEVQLPRGKLGATFKGKEAPLIHRLSLDSPMVGEFQIGMAVDKFILADGSVLTGLTTKELVRELINSADTEGRQMVLVNPATQQMSGKDVSLPDSIEVVLPRGKVGATFKGYPPKITSIKDDSPVKDTFRVGMVVDMLILDRNNKIIELDTKLLTTTLSESAETYGRIIVLKNPETAEMSKLPDFQEVELPRGKLGVTFRKGEVPIVKKIGEDSSVIDKVQIGMAVDVLTLGDGTSYTGLTTKELLAELKKNADSDERKILLKNPKTQTMSDKQTVSPDEKEVRLPPGRLGVTFKRTPPTITAISDDSPMKDLFVTGMVVDTLDIPGPDGGKYAGLSAKELVGLLADSKELEGRKVLLKNPETAILSERSFQDHIGDVEVFEGG